MTASTMAIGSRSASSAIVGVSLSAMMGACVPFLLQGSRVHAVVVCTVDDSIDACVASMPLSGALGKVASGDVSAHLATRWSPTADTGSARRERRVFFFLLRMPSAHGCWSMAPAVDDSARSSPIDSVSARCIAPDHWA